MGCMSDEAGMYFNVDHIRPNVVLNKKIKNININGPCKIIKHKHVRRY